VAETAARTRVLNAIRHGVIVSCQADAGSPLDAPEHIAAIAVSAERGGAVGLRIDNPVNVCAVRAATTVPLIGIYKQHVPGSDVYITPTFEAARSVVEAGADIVALDGTPRMRPEGQTLAGIVRRVHDELGVAVMADVSTVEEAVAAARAGADLVATTLAGYTPYSDGVRDNAALAARIVAAVQVPVIVEGGLWTVDDVRAGFAAGAFAVVVGSAVTAPELITRRLSAAAPRFADADGEAGV
jgi:N-acylglucosamine-6-phosphate 2-epimerase